MDHAFQNSVIDALVKLIPTSKLRPLKDVINVIYKGTPEQSPARRLLVDFWCWTSNPKWNTSKNITKSLPLEFVDDLVVAMVKNKSKLGDKNARPWVRNPK